MSDSDPVGVEVHGTRVHRVTYYGRAQEVLVMTDEQRAAQIRALLEERRGYEARGDVERLQGVDAELARLGAAGAAPAKRATTRED